MKKQLLYIVAIFTCLCVWSCGNQSSDKDKQRIAELEARLNRLENDNSLSQTNTSNDNISSSENNDQIDSDEDEYVGKYKVEDTKGRIFYIELNSEKGAVVTADGYEPYYCEWVDYSISGGDRKIICSDEGVKPLKISFKGGEKQFGTYQDNGTMSLVLHKGWVYEDLNKSASQNPNWRIKATKIK